MTPTAARTAGLAMGHGPGSVTAWKTHRAGALQLARGEVHVWRVPLNVPPDTAAERYRALSDGERARSARLRFARDRRRFTVTRGVLRELLGRYLRTDPGWIRFVYNEYGKPALSPECGMRLKFNVSHAADLAVIVVAAGTDVGVDIEQVRPHPDYAAVAQQCFTPGEVAELHGLPARLQAEAFLSRWTRKEAYAKARGLGLHLPFTSFSVPLTADAVHIRGGASARRWLLYPLQPAPGYVGALAVAGGALRLRHLNHTFFSR